MKDLPPHFLREKEKEVVFHIPGAFPTPMVAELMQAYFPEYKTILIRCAETFYRMRESARVWLLIGKNQMEQSGRKSSSNSKGLSLFMTSNCWMKEQQP